MTPSYERGPEIDTSKTPAIADSGHPAFGERWSFASRHIIFKAELF